MFLKHSVATQGPQISQANSKKEMQIQIWGWGGGDGTRDCYSLITVMLMAQRVKIMDCSPDDRTWAYSTKAVTCILTAP